MPLTLALSGCSYSYDVVASVRDGRLVLMIDPSSPQKPSCLRRVEIIPKDGRNPVWEESVGYDDDCANRFPLPYGTRLKGQHQEGQGVVQAQQLRRGVIYDISTTTGATGYGGGRFIVHSNGSVENLPYKE